MAPAGLDGVTCGAGVAVAPDLGTTLPDPFPPPQDARATLARSAPTITFIKSPFEEGAVRR